MSQSADGSAYTVRLDFFISFLAGYFPFFLNLLVRRKNGEVIGTFFFMIVIKRNTDLSQFLASKKECFYF